MTRIDEPVPVAAMNIVASLDAREIALLESVLEKRNYGAREKIIREGESADSLFLLAAGTVSVYLKLTNWSAGKTLELHQPRLGFWRAVVARRPRPLRRCRRRCARGLLHPVHAKT